MPNSEQRSKVTIEDLLKLKRAERPAPEFWNNFERELRQKQLTALIEKRSWWQTLPQLISRRAYLPAGVTAIVAFTLVTVRFASPTAVSVAESGPAPTMSMPTVSPTNTLAVVAVAPVSSPLVNRKEHTALTVDDRVAIPARNQYTSSAQPTLPLIAATETREELTPSARSIAANLAQLEQSEPELVSAVMGNRLSAPAKPVTDTGAAVEFASLSSSSARRGRMLAQYSEKTVNPAPAAPEAVRERLARRLSDLDYGDRFTRIGLKGDQVSLKF